MPYVTQLFSPGTRFAALLLSLLLASSCGDGGGDGTADTVTGSNPVDTAVGSDTATDAPDTVTGASCTPKAPTVPADNAFVDISDQSGIRVGNYLQDPPANIKINDHSRLAFADLDGDGFDDIVAHSLFPNPQAGVPFDHLVFLNNGDGTFRDHSDASGLRASQTAFFLFGDVDNDGDQDAFGGLDIQLGGERSRVYLNDGNAVFTPVANAGPDHPSLPTFVASAVFLDYDRDGILDLFVGQGGTVAQVPDQLYRGIGDGTFSDVTSLLQTNPAHPTNGSVACDFDNDGDVDIAVSTYGVSVNLGANILWEAGAGGVFANAAVARGFASLPGGNPWIAATGFGQDPEPGSGPGRYIGSNGFGIDCGDFDNDGDIDIFLATISHPGGSHTRTWSDATQLLINGGADASWAFADEARQRGLPFNEGDIDAAMVDFDNDGRLDLSLTRDRKYEGNYNDVDQKAWFGLMRQADDGTLVSMGPTSGINDLDTTQLATLVECTDDGPCPDTESCMFSRCRIPCTEDAQCGKEFCDPRGFCKPYLKMKSGQNHAWSDIDHDGDLDLLVGGRDTGGGRPNFLFRNDVGQDNRWVGLRLEGDGVKVNRDAIGARVTLRWPDGTLLMREIRSSRGTYNSADQRAPIFGLGERGCDYAIEVSWPDGTTASLPPQPEGRYHSIRYPDLVAAP